MTNKKDYFKGLGTGIIVTSALFFIFVYFTWPSTPSTVDESNMTQIVEETTEADKDGTSIAKNTETDTADKAAETAKDDVERDIERQNTMENDTKKGEKEITSDVVEENHSVEKDVDESDSGKEDKPVDELANDVKIINVVIPSGYTSNGVGIILYEHGIIEDYKAFNEHSILVKKDYSIRSGTYQLAKGASFDEILAVIAP
ncbi:hypothetical protein [Vallitalea okinawensis]|uniref:hypothetical protein n=1 Tax=Vallitalea okinawensis TaxID=2078660 RepID=UPI000CFDB1C5|nr:hypothetical protein [Vallitalea okinawensis]